MGCSHKPSIWGYPYFRKPPYAQDKTGDQWLPRPEIHHRGAILKLPWEPSRPGILNSSAHEHEIIPTKDSRHSGWRFQPWKKAGARNWRWKSNVYQCVSRLYPISMLEYQTWLVVWTPLKNISQLGWLFPIYGKKKWQPNHQPETYLNPAASMYCPDLRADLATLTLPQRFVASGMPPNWCASGEDSAIQVFLRDNSLKLEPQKQTEIKNTVSCSNISSWITRVY